MALGDIIDTGIAKYVVLCRLFQHILGLPANDHTKLTFIVDAFPVARQDDFVVGADNGSRWFEEDKWHARRRQFKFLNMAAVIEAEANYLGGETGGKQPHFIQFVGASIKYRRIAKSLELGEKAAPEPEYDIFLQQAVFGLALGGKANYAHTHPPHGVITWQHRELPAPWTPNRWP